MARTLPWMVDRDAPVKKARATPAPYLKQEKITLPKKGDESGGEEIGNGRGRTSKASAIPKPNPRTPSSSPVRGPPPIELMHDGYDRDDIFIMVEDEFQTVAQSYTAHLHHAEYKRLVKQARQAPPKALPEPTSPMSKRTKNRLRAVALEKRQKESLRRVMGQETNEEGGEEDKVVDLWSGTSLGLLMANSSQQKRSLLGLERISSNTKAGLGVTRRQGSRREARDEEDDDLTITNPKPLVKQENVVRTTKHRAVENRNYSHRNGAELVSTSQTAEREVSERQRDPVQSKPTERRVTKRKFFLNFDDESDQPTTRSKFGDKARKLRGEASRSTSATLPNSNVLLKRKTDNEQEKKRSRLDEVPLFIP